MGKYHMETGYNNARLFIEKGMKFSAIVCGNDLIALGALNAIKDKGLRVPQDISLIGYDDIFLAAMVEPRLTTIRQPRYEISTYAMDLLVKLMEREHVEDRVKWFIPRLVERASVKKLP